MLPSWIRRDGARHPSVTLLRVSFPSLCESASKSYAHKTWGRGRGDTPRTPRATAALSPTAAERHGGRRGREGVKRYRPRKTKPLPSSGEKGLYFQYPWGDSNSRTRLRRPLLYPLSYRGTFQVYHKMGMLANFYTARYRGAKLPPTDWGKRIDFSLYLL